MPGFLHRLKMPLKISTGQKSKENAGIELLENTNFKEAEDQLQPLNNCTSPFINK